MENKGKSQEEKGRKGMKKISASHGKEIAFQEAVEGEKEEVEEWGRLEEKWKNYDVIREERGERGEGGTWANGWDKKEKNGKREGHGEIERNRTAWRSRESEGRKKESREAEEINGKEGKTGGEEKIKDGNQSNPLLVNEEEKDNFEEDEEQKEDLSALLASGE